MPITSDPPATPRKDENPPSMAPASAGTTSSVRVWGSRPVIGTMRTPARPANAEPITQFAVDTASGE